MLCLRFHPFSHLCSRQFDYASSYSSTKKYYREHIDVQRIRWDRWFYVQCLFTYIYLSICDWCVFNLCLSTLSLQCVLVIVLLVHGSCEAVQCYTGIGEPAIVRLQDGRAVNCSTVDGVLLWCICVSRRSLYTIELCCDCAERVGAKLCINEYYAYECIYFLQCNTLYCLFLLTIHYSLWCWLR